MVAGPSVSTVVVALADSADSPHFDMIVPGLALGNEEAAHDRHLLQERGIVAVINATTRDNPWAALLRKRGVACMQECEARSYAPSSVRLALMIRRIFQVRIRVNPPVHAGGCGGSAYGGALPLLRAFLRLHCAS